MNNCDIPLVVGVYLPNTKAQYHAMQMSKWSQMNDHEKQFDGASTWMPVNPLSAQDGYVATAAIFQRTKVYRNWELGVDQGYAANYVSIPVKL